MSQAGRVTAGLQRGFLFYAFCGWLLGLLVVMIFFLGALRFAKPENDDALEVFAVPAFLIIGKILGGAGFVRSKTARVRKPLPAVMARTTVSSAAFSRVSAQATEASQDRAILPCCIPAIASS
jgi:hypothetical protein